MNKIITTVFLMVMGITSVVAQKNDPAAKKILDAVSAKFKTFKAVQASFSLGIENAAGKNLGTKKGTVYMKGLKYRVSISNGQEIYCDGNAVSTFDKSTNEVNITKIDPSANSLTPQKIFTNFYDKDFLYRLNGEKSIGGKMLQELELTPTDKSKPFFKVLVYVDNATKTISSTKVFEKTGNRFVYGISNMNTTAAVSDALFVFDAKKFPGVEVIDLR